MKLQLKTFKQMLNFFIKALNMNDNRIAKRALSALVNQLKAGPDRYNWASWMRDSLFECQMGSLIHAITPGDVLQHKQEILSNMETYLRGCDLQKAEDSTHYNYCATLIADQQIRNLLHIPLEKLRLIAKVRLNKSQFYFRKVAVILKDSMIC